ACGGQRQVCEERDGLLDNGPWSRARCDALQFEGYCVAAEGEGLDFSCKDFKMKKKSEKKKDLDSLREKLADTATVFLTGYEKMTVEEDFELRKTVRGAGGNYKVIKNRIAEKAGEGKPAGDLLKDLKGMLAVAYTSGDPVALAKALTTYGKANPAFSFKAGLV